MRMELSSLLKETYLGIELHSSTSRHPLLLPSILCQCKTLHIALAKLFLKIIQNLLNNINFLAGNNISLHKF